LLGACSIEKNEELATHECTICIGKNSYCHTLDYTYIHFAHFKKMVLVKGSSKKETNFKKQILKQYIFFVFKKP